jgi:hypothetical protein
VKNVTILVQVVVDVNLYRTDAYGRIIFKWILKKQGEGVDWINITEDGIQCEAVVNTVMTLQVS